MSRDSDPFASDSCCRDFSHGVPHQVTVGDHDLTVFVESLPWIASLLLDLRAARTRIWIETYIFFDDSAGRAVCEVLKSKASDGVEVRLLYDAIGSKETPTSFFEEMRQAGVHVHAFHSIWEAFWRFSFLRVLNRRNHRKLAIIDDQIAYFGGMNIIEASRTMLGTGESSLPRSAGWRDVHLRMVGPRQSEIAASVDRSWRLAHAEPLPRQRVRPIAALEKSTDESLSFFDIGPGRGRIRGSRLFAWLVQRAHKQVTLSMAYFLPVGAVLKALLKAARRGVRMRVVVPEVSDVPIVQRASKHLYQQLLRRRFRIYERQLTMLHSKVMVVDDEWSVVGSCNLDARSLRINLEFAAVIRSRALAKVLMEIANHEIGQSRRITRKETLSKGWWSRLLNRLAWGLRWWL